MRLSDSDELDLMRESLSLFNANRADRRVETIARLVTSSMLLKQLDKEIAEGLP